MTTSSQDFIGLGIMGMMAGRYLIKAGHQLFTPAAGPDRDHSTAAPLADAKASHNAPTSSF
jgi:3-hydroxyisobutyrate dehydrogenase-like beta-hydroxyacid dehydrogenase